MPREAVLTAVAASACLVLGFAVAQATGVRWLGGIVLLAGAAWCGRRWWRAAGPARAVLAVAAFGVAFAVSHPLGRAIGPWPSVLLVAVLAGLAALGLTAGRRPA